MAPPVDLALDPIADVPAIAAAVLLEHIGDHGRCMACGSAWPCTPAALAEHHLAGI